MLDEAGRMVCYRKGTKVMVIQAFDGTLLCAVDDSAIYAFSPIPEIAKKSPDCDADYKKKQEKKKYNPPMDHPWRRSTFRRFLHDSPHRPEYGVKTYA